MTDTTPEDRDAVAPVPTSAADGAAEGEAEQAPPPAERTLYLTAGLPVPPRLESDVGQLSKLPAAALERLWEVLGPFLHEPVPKDMAKRLAAFGKHHQLAPQTLTDVLRACRMIFREAARWHLSQEQLAKDLSTLSDDAKVIEALMAGFKPAMDQLHHEITYRTVADHGRLLADVTWRLDAMISSARGEEIREPVASLTIMYMEGPETKRITVQALPREVEKLRDVCNIILTAGP